MPKYIIQRDIPGASNYTAQQLKDISKKSCEVISKMGSEIQWLHSYVTDDKIYSVYIASNKELIQEHARQGGIPANVISKVTTIIDPTTSE
ncbi:MAG: DUF4242 domain-containing protein [Ferruginibacter sp.]|nr:DUF4242 domain-containing protein [Ferruginibacter sp.]